MNNKHLFHIHTYRCGHAGNENDEAYILKALELGAKKLTFTDHAPFPENPFGNRMNYEQLDEYISTLSALKEKYREKIKIEIGLEIEYLPDYENYYKEKSSHYWWKEFWQPINAYNSTQFANFTFHFSSFKAACSITDFVSSRIPWILYQDF